MPVPAPLAGLAISDPVETAELLAFTRIVDARSISRAAAELRVPRATISRRLARLESHLAVRLLRRTSRSLALTDAGEALYQHARLVLDAVSHAEASVRRADGAVRGELRVSVLPLLTRGLRVLLADFARMYPGVRLQVNFSSATADIARGECDVALRGTTELPPGLVARTLVRMPMLALAAPAYLAEHGTPRERGDLREHRCLMGFARGALPDTNWPLLGGGQIHVTGSLFSNDMTMLCESALAGLGIALLPLNVAMPYLEAGQLVHVLPGVVGREIKISVVYLEREFTPPQVRAFVDFVVERGAQAMGLDEALANIQRYLERNPAPVPERPATKRAARPRVKSATRGSATQSDRRAGSRGPKKSSGSRGD